MEVWVVMAIIITMMGFIGFLLLDKILNFAAKFGLELIVFFFLFFIVILVSLYLSYRENKVKSFCVYFPETEICKAIDKEPGYLTFKQKNKMIQRVKEEDNKRKGLKKIQDIEIE